MKVKYTSFEEQQGKQGRPFRLSATERGEDGEWLHKFKYIGTKEFFTLVTDSNYKLKRKE